MNPRRKEIVDHLSNQIRDNKELLREQYNSTKNKIGFFYLDNILPESMANDCFNVFPGKAKMRRLKSMKEYKYVSAQMNQHDNLLEDVIYAFQDEKIVDLISEICEIDSVYADDSLYAGGLSLMGHENFLNPHLDNSHDAKRERWRVLNLLYYVTPEWQESYGGNLEVWPDGPKKEPIVIESKFNRLVVMATHDGSWHSVNPVLLDKNRCCISNYFFSDEPLHEHDKFHVTKFRGRPGDTFTNILLDTDAEIRMMIRKIFKKGIRKNPHIYKK